MAGLNVINADSFPIQAVDTEAEVASYDVPTEMETIISAVANDAGGSQDFATLQALAESYLITEVVPVNRGVTFWADYVALCQECLIYCIARAVDESTGDEAGGEIYIGITGGVPALELAYQVDEPLNYTTLSPPGDPAPYDAIYWAAAYTSMKQVAQSLAEAYIELWNSGGSQQPQVDAVEDNPIEILTNDTVDAFAFDLESDLPDIFGETEEEEDEEEDEPDAAGDALSGFAKQTDRYASFSEHVHQRGTFTPTKFVSTLFKKRKDKDDAEPRDQSRSSR